MSKAKKPDQLVQSLDRALNILELLVQSGQGLGVTEISNSTGLHKSTVYRLLSTLSYRGYVEQKERDNRYKIGLKMFEIGSKVLNNLDFRTRIKSYLIQLMTKTEETVHLGILDSDEIIYIDKVESPKTIRMSSNIGRRAPAHCTSLGKVILAYSSEQTVKKVINNRGLRAFTENTITDHIEFKKHLAEIKQKGFAVDNEEQEWGIRCIAGPIFDYKGDILGAFSISGPATRLTEERVEKLTDLVTLYSIKISSSLGYSPSE